MSDKKEWVVIPGYPKFETDRVSVRSVKQKNIQSKSGNKYRIYHENGERHSLSLEEILALVNGKSADTAPLVEKAVESQQAMSEGVRDLLTDKKQVINMPVDAVVTEIKADGPKKPILPAELAEAKAIDAKPELTDKSKSKLDKAKANPGEKKGRSGSIKPDVLKLVSEGKNLNQIMEAHPEWKRNTVYIIILKENKKPKA